MRFSQSGVTFARLFTKLVNVKNQLPECNREVELLPRGAALCDDSWIVVDDVARLELVAIDAVDDVLLRRRLVRSLARVERAQNVGLKKC